MQQEPRLMATYAQDENMINAYNQGKDLYATIAMGVYHNRYEDNLEQYPDGSANPEGKKRRGNCKSLLLGILYGRGVNSIAEQIGGTYEEAQKIIDDFFKGFPKVKQWIDKTQTDAKKYGFVEDLWGRRRRLPDLSLPKYSIKVSNTNSTFNPILDVTVSLNQNNELEQKYRNLLDGVKYRKQYESLKEQAKKEGVTISDNGGFIAEAERQCVNSRIQGGAATLTKIAMIDVYRNEELKKLGFKLLIAVHDELIGECPEENKDRVAELLTQSMIQTARRYCPMNFKCDATIEKHWYEEEVKGIVSEEYHKAIEAGTLAQTAFNKILEERPELTEEQLSAMLELNK